MCNNVLDVLVLYHLKERNISGRMDLNELFEIVDIESAEDFKYFDNFAALMESDDYIPAEVMYELFAEVDTDVLSELTDNYFEDIMEGVPEEEAELFTLLDNIKRVLKGYAENTDDERSIVLFTDEVSRFRNWYNFDTDVECQSRKDGSTRTVPVREALVLYRIEKLRADEYMYDFSECLDYPLDEYVVSFTSDADGDTGYEPGNEEEELLNSDFLFDDEFSDEY
jgi:hypothetical protein